MTYTRLNIDYAAGADTATLTLTGGDGPDVRATLPYTRGDVDTLLAAHAVTLPRQLPAAHPILPPAFGAVRARVALAPLPAATTPA